MSEIASSVTKIESKNPNQSWLDAGRGFVERNCRLLYPEHIGWYVGRGWYEILKDLSVELETLNHIYGKYGIRITAERVKEKFGGLRFYYGVAIMPPWYYTAIGEFFDKIKDFIYKKVFFDFEYVEVVPTHYHHNIQVVDRANLTKTDFACGRYIKLENGKTMILSHPMCYRTMKQVPRRNRFVYTIAVACGYIGRKLNFMNRFTPSRKQEVIRNFIDKKVHKLVSEAEDKSYLTCEECGEGLEKGTVCNTEGWIMTLCRECADKTGKAYRVGEKTYRNGVELKGEANLGIS